jgi:transposase
LVQDVRLLDRRISAVEERIQTAVMASKTSLTTLHGIGPVLAAKLLGEVGDVGRFPTKASSRPTTAPPRSRPPAAKSSATACRGPATAASTMCCI